MVCTPHLVPPKKIYVSGIFVNTRMVIELMWAEMPQTVPSRVFVSCLFNPSLHGFLFACTLQLYVEV